MRNPGTGAEAESFGKYMLQSGVGVSVETDYGKQVRAGNTNAGRLAECTSSMVEAEIRVMRKRDAGEDWRLCMVAEAEATVREKDMN